MKIQKKGENTSFLWQMQLSIQNSLTVYILSLIHISFSPFGIAGFRPIVGEDIANGAYGDGSTPTPTPTVTISGTPTPSPSVTGAGTNGTNGSGTGKTDSNSGNETGGNTGDSNGISNGNTNGSSNGTSGTGNGGSSSGTGSSDGSDNSGTSNTPVSYTHLDVYKRQVATPHPEQIPSSPAITGTFAGRQMLLISSVLEARCV